MTPDESRALALLVREQPVLRSAVIQSGWNGVSPEAQVRAEDLFREWWGWDVRHESARHLPGKHDQKSHGRQGGAAGESTAEDQALAEAIHEVYVNGGGTLDPHGWSSPTTGICVARRKSDICADGVENGEIVPADDFFGPGGARILADYVDSRVQTFMSEEGRNEWGLPKVGLWHNTKDGRVYLDVTDVVPSSQRDAALRRGREQNQISVFDLDTFEEIPTGGSGRGRQAVEGDRGRASPDLGDDDSGGEGGLGGRSDRADAAEGDVALRYNPQQPRHPSGSSKGGQFASGGAISAGVQKGSKSRVANPVDAPDGTDWDALSPETRAKVAEAWGKAGLPVRGDGSPDIDALSSNIIDAYRQTSAEDMRDGVDWYARAHSDAVEIAQRLGVSEEVGAGLLSSLSPQTAWENNVVWAHHAARMIAEDPIIDWDRPVRVDSQDGLTVGSVCVWAGVDVSRRGRLSDFTAKEQAALIAAYGKQPMLAVRVGGVDRGKTINANYIINSNLEKFVVLARSEGTAQDISTALGGHKTRSFYNAIVTGGQTDSVTVDSHAFDVAVLGPAAAEGGAHVTKEQANLLTSGSSVVEGLSGFAYPVTVAAYRDATSTINSERKMQDLSPLSPAQVQAIVWGGTLRPLGGV